MKIAVIALLLCVVASGAHAQNTYFVDSNSGSDSNQGTTEQSAFRSLEKVNQLELHPGDSLLFKREARWAGTLRPKGSGSEEHCITIGAYGNGAAPIIDAEGRKEDADFMSASIVLYNQEYWEIRDLEVRNFEKGKPTKPSNKAGILVLAKDVGTLHNFKFENLRISNVNGSLKTRENGGVFFNVIADDDPKKRVPTNFDNVHLNRCYFLNVDRGGFLNQSFWRKRDLHTSFGEGYANGRRNNWYPSRRILIEHCKFEDVGGNGLVTRVASSPVVQDNLFVRCSSKTTGNASYPYNCDNALWQYNEACYTVYNEGDIDASGFDSDYLCKNTVIQHNYSHHNDWGGLLVCCWGTVKGSFNDGTLVKSNVFQDEKHHLIRFSGNITNTEISNNLFVIGAKIDDVLLWYKDWGDSWPDGTLLKNNIFHNSGASRFLKLGEASNNTLSSNGLWGNPFDDYNNFVEVQDEAALNSRIAEIRKIGARKEFSVSRAREVAAIMLPLMKFPQAGRK
jgi:hypothetical protein